MIYRTASNLTKKIDKQLTGPITKMGENIKLKKKIF